MALYAVGDFHLSLSGEKPMDIFGDRWADHTGKIKESFSMLNSDDVCVLCGDLSWAMSLDGAEEDFRFINDLPGKKIILKGNHDYWWSTKAKMDKYIAEKGFDSISILHNNYYAADGIALCGSRGWFYDAEEDADKLILNREVGRLRMSIEPALRDGYEPIVFLHYPPIYNNMECDEILGVLKEYNIKKCFYGHIHGGNAAKKAFIGEKYGINFKLIACDYLGFMPLAVN